MHSMMAVWCSTDAMLNLEMHAAASYTHTGAAGAVHFFF
jgi:hypothetical protein